MSYRIKRAEFLGSWIALILLMILFAPLGLLYFWMRTVWIEREVTEEGLRVALQAEHHRSWFASKWWLRDRD